MLFENNNLKFFYFIMNEIGSREGNARKEELKIIANT
jgi:hypothetical protein